MKPQKDEKLISAFRKCKIARNKGKEVKFFTDFICYITDKRIVLEPENKTELNPKILDIGLKIMGVPGFGRKMFVDDMINSNCTETIVLMKNSSMHADLNERNICTVDITTKDYIAYLNFRDPIIANDVCLAINSPEAYLLYND